MTPEAEFLSAIASGDTVLARALLAAHPHVADARDGAGASALMLSLYRGAQELVEEILSHRNNLDLWEAVATGEMSRVVHLLLTDPASVNMQSPDGFTPLGFAAFFGETEILEYLLKNGADVNLPSSNPMRVRPIHSAAAHRNADTAATMVRALLRYAAEVQVAQHGGWTPLHQAAAHGNRTLVRLLLQHGADPSARSDDGKTPLDLAREKGHNEVVRMLSW